MPVQDCHEIAGRAGSWSVFSYRRLCKVDAIDRASGDRRTQRFDFLLGDEATIRGFFAEFRVNPQVLATELRDPTGTVVDRSDRLVELLPRVDAALVRAAVMEGALLRADPG